MNPAPGSAKSFPCVPRLVALTGISRWVHAGPSQSLAYNDHYHTGPIFQITSVSSICGQHSFFFIFLLSNCAVYGFLVFWPGDRSWAHSSASTEFYPLDHQERPAFHSCLIDTSFHIHGLSEENHIFLPTVYSTWDWGMLLGFIPQLFLLPAEYPSLFCASVS